MYVSQDKCDISIVLMKLPFQKMNFSNEVLIFQTNFKNL